MSSDSSPTQSDPTSPHSPHLPSSKVKVTVIDVSVGRNDSDHKVTHFAFVSRNEVLRSDYDTADQLPEDRGEAVDVMSKALGIFLTMSQNDGFLARAILGVGTALPLAKQNESNVEEPKNGEHCNWNTWSV